MVARRNYQPISAVAASMRSGKRPATSVRAFVASVTNVSTTELYRWTRWLRSANSASISVPVADGGEFSIESVNLPVMAKQAKLQRRTRLVMHEPLGYSL